ncbi:MAG: SCP2 sterol-binding domain-containing protein [Candidatus Sigynarchaeota archaeon]
MPLFLSQEWVDAYTTELNKSTAYEEAAKTWEGDFVFIGRDDKTKEIVMAAYFDLWHGKCRKAYKIDDLKNLPKSEFVYDGPISNWKKVLSKELDPIQGLMSGKFKLTGNMSKVMRAVKAAQELVNTTMKIKTEWP